MAVTWRRSSEPRRIGSSAVTRTWIGCMTLAVQSTGGVPSDCRGPAMLAADPAVSVAATRVQAIGMRRERCTGGSFGGGLALLHHAPRESPRSLDQGLTPA